jgi:hypothetical protein
MAALMRSKSDLPLKLADLVDLERTTLRIQDAYIRVRGMSDLVAG